ncbi:MAG TPA: aminoacyl-tRNA hydrolase [Haliangiales bacterium]|nr:aminoacyl-tRNA hydrolase [Haliangiales bacterium]
MWLVVGLGNPGREYAGNRHNIGFMVVDEVARRARLGSFRAKFGGDLASGEIAGQKVALVKPMEYMNVSGRAVQRTAAFYQIGPTETLVVHDEIDLPLGTVRVKVGGGHAGHNGLRSIIQDLGSAEFARIRCGVGKRGEAASHVLGDFSKAEKTEVDIMIQVAADAVEDVLRRGALLAMNTYNVRDKD